jgi:5'-3' exonuclease
MRRIGGSKLLKHVLIDGGNLSHRSHHAALKAGKYTNNGTTYHFINTLNEYLRKTSPFDSVNVFWDGVSVYRKNLFPGYKLKRKKSGVLENRLSYIFDNYVVNDEQDLLRKFLSLLGVNQYYSPDHEADDLIATYVKDNNSSINVVVSDDKDFIPLLSNPRAVIYRPITDTFLDAESADKFLEALGINHQEYFLYKVIYGDMSDNIKGVPFYPKKNAKAACSFRDLNSLLSSNVDSTILNPLLKHVDLLKLNEKLVSFIREINLDTYLTKSCRDLEIFKKMLSQIGMIYPKYSQFLSSSPSLPDWYADL